LFGGDAWYHMRRIVYTLEHFPQTLGFDPYLNFPDGARAIWPPLFDFAVASLLLPVNAVAGLPAVEAAAALVPPLLGAATVGALYGLVCSLYDRTTALVAAALLSVSSGHIWYSQLGFVDHHAAVALVSTGLLAAAVSCVRREVPSARIGVALAAAMALSFLLWPGALLYVALVEVGLGAHWLARGDRAAAVRIAENRVWTRTLACGLVMLFGPSGLSGSSQAGTPWSPFSAVVESWFQPWWLAAIALHAAICALLWRRASAGLTARRRLGETIVVAAGVLAASLWAFPDLRHTLDEAWRWLGKREGFQSIVAESEPLFVLHGEWTGRVAELRLSRFVYVFPAALALLAHSARRTDRRAGRWLFAFWAMCVALVTLQQKRFFNTGSIALAIVMSWSIVAAWRVVLVRPGLVGRRRTLIAAGFAAAVYFLLAPSLAPLARAGGDLVRSVRGEAPRIGLARLADRSLLRTATWLRGHTPPTAGYEDARGEPAYGVLAHWDLGHALLYAARRPTVVGNFGDDLGERNYRLHREYFRSTEGRAVRLLDALRARYVVVARVPPQAWVRLGSKSMLSLLTGPEPERLVYHRLVYESPRANAPEVFLPGYRVFERVAGPHP